MVLTENIEQDNLKLIRLDNNQFVIVDLKAEIKENDVVIYDFGMGVCIENPVDVDNLHSNTRSKIIFATPGLNLEGINIIEEKNNEVLIPFPSNELNLRDGKEIKTWMCGWEDGYKEAQAQLYTKEQVEEAIKLAQTVDYEVDAYTILRDFKMRSNENIFNKLKQVKVEVNLTDNTAKFI